MGETALGRAVLKLETDRDSYTKGLDKAKADAFGFRSGLDDVKSSLAGIGPAIVGAFAVGSIVAGAKQVIDYAGHVSDLSARLKVSTDTVQEWEAAFGPAGVSIDSVAKASEQLADKIIGGDKNAVKALKQLGFTVDELKRMKPEDRLIAVADAVGKIQDSAEQLYVSKTLFGKGGPELLAALDGNLGATIARMRDLGVVIDEETIAAADEFGDQLGLMGKQLMGILATVIGPLLPALSALGNALMWLGQHVIGPVLTVAVKGAVTILGIFWERTAEILGRLAELGSKLPWVGDKFAALSTWLKDSAATSGAYVEKLWQQNQATETVGATTAKARSALRGFGGDAESTGKKLDEATRKQTAWTASIEQATIKANLGIFTLNKYGAFALPQATKGIAEQHDALMAWIPLLDSATAHIDATTEELERLRREGKHQVAMWAEIGNAIHTLPTRTRTAAEAYRDELGGIDVSTQGLLGKVRGWVENIPSAIGSIQKKTASVLTGLFGGSTGSVLGSVVSTGLNFAFGPLGGLASQLMSQGLEALAGVAWKGLQKIGGFFKNLFGGPSKDELAGRDLVAAFESNLSKMLTDAQRLEAGTDAWKQTVIALRDRYLALGLTEQDAMRDAERLWKSSKEGAEASRRVIEEIRRKLGELGQGVEIPIRYDVEEPELPPVVDGDTIGALTGSALTARGGSSLVSGLSTVRATTQAGDVVIALDGREIARAQLPHLYGALQTFALAR